ncbi:MAG: hypothetical protein K2L55_01730 [Muribaculaceae bacterium]|nr:hypothetical protein [Muribaculaceae bacterium]
MATEETVNAGTGATVPTSPGAAGVQSQAPGTPTTVSSVASATGGIAPGNLIETDIDTLLFRFQSEDTALMSLMLKAKKVKVNSPEVEHFMIDEQRSTLTTDSAVAASTKAQFILPLVSSDQNIPRDYHTLLVPDVDGYAADGQTVTPGKSLMLFVTGRDATTDNPIVRAVNGPKANATDAFCTTPAIPAGSKVKLLANAMYETQKEVDPDLIVPRPSIVYLQKRGMNQVVSDYFEAQKKHIPFTQSLIAEQAILNFKRAGNRTLWVGQKGKFPIKVPKLGEQMIYFTEGIRWQFKRELQHSGKWTFEKLIALAKMYFTGEDVPKTALLLSGKNLLEELQCIDFSKHPEVQISVKTNKIGWEVTSIHTVFGDIEIKREPTLDTLGLSNSGALIGEDRLVHYLYSQQHEFSDRVEGEEATRKGVVVWDGLALKGACHIWIDGEGDTANAGATTYAIWDSPEAPADDDLVEGRVYLLTADCPGISASAQNGQMWQYKGEADGWVEFTGEIVAD